MSNHPKSLEILQNHLQLLKTTQHFKISESVGLPSRRDETRDGKHAI